MAALDLSSGVFTTLQESLMLQKDIKMDKGWPAIYLQISAALPEYELLHSKATF